jgi:tetratricopeptide (TPR) repeat protein
MHKLCWFIAAVVLAAPSFGQSVIQRPIVYQVPEMVKVQVKENIEFRKVNDTSLTLDIYYPPGFNKRSNLPVVIFNNGVGSMDLPKWRVYQDWARLIAANGMIAVNHQGRPNRATVWEDCIAVLDYLRNNGQQLNIDTGRIGIWTCSANCRTGIPLALRPGREYIRTLVAYYGASDSIGRMRQDVPTLVVRAGLDAQGLNMAIEGFVQAALQLDVRLEMINYLEGMHAFDIFNNTPESKDIIKRTVDFLKKNLTNPVPVARDWTLTNRNFMWMMNTGQSKEAVAEFRKAVVHYRSDSTFHPFYNGVIREDVLNANAYWLLRNGKPAEALEAFKLMVETYPSSANAHDSLGDAYEAMGNKALAVAEAEKTLELLPNDRTINDQMKETIKKAAEEKIKRLKN